MSVLGKWRIMEMPDYTDDYPDTTEPAYILFEPMRGEFAFGCVTGSFAGGADQGGWAELQSDGTLIGEICFHGGDEISFTARHSARSEEAEVVETSICPWRRSRMDIHKNARLTVHGRERIVWLLQSGHSVAEVVEILGVTDNTVRKWRDRHLSEGPAGLQDRSSRPHRLCRPMAQAVVDRIEALRRQRLTGQAVAAETGVSPATVSRILKRLGLNRLSPLEPAEPPRRYQRERPRA